MRKIMLMLLAVAATINAMAADPSYTAKAKVTLSSGSGYYCHLMLAEAPEFGSLDGAVMNMEDRVIALYVLKGTTKLQSATAANLDDVKVGLKTNGSASYTIDVSEVDGDKTLYLYDEENLVGYALTDGAHYTFEAEKNTTIDDRFYLTKTLPKLDPLNTCFTGTVLQINSNPYPGKIHVKWNNGSKDKDVSLDRKKTTSIDFTRDTFYSSTTTTTYTIEFGSGASKHAFNVTVTKE